MPINNFQGETFVAFIDISGFKELMKNQKRVLKALDKFYGYGYSLLRNNSSIQGIFISDCGILFSRDQLDPKRSLKSLLNVIREINCKMREDGFMLMTSIAYGEFRYQDRIVFSGINKDLLYGNAYLSAYTDNTTTSSRIQPGQCRVVTGGLPNPDRFLDPEDDVLSFLEGEHSNRKHYYFYWMVQTSSQIQDFKKIYKDAYNLKFAGMLNALKEYSH